MKMNKRILHIAFCVNDEYSSYIRVPIKSILENIREKNFKTEIHILSDHISKRNEKRINNVIKNNINIKIHFYKVNDECLRHLKTGNWPIHTWYRILIPELLPYEVERVLYLDADTLVTGDLSELLTINLNNIAVAGAPDLQFFESKTYDRLNYPFQKGYICAGVLLMNLNFWRKKNLTFSIINWANENRELLCCPDQDAINYICRNEKIILPLKYGFVNGFIKNKQVKEKFGSQVDIKPVIIHYCSTPPWYKEYAKNHFHNEWVKYNDMLDKPIKRHYQAKGLLKFKICLWNLLHCRILK